MEILFGEHDLLAFDFSTSNFRSYWFLEILGQRPNWFSWQCSPVLPLLLFVAILCNMFVTSIIEA
jgi:hypothetical protein